MSELGESFKYRRQQRTVANGLQYTEIRNKHKLEDFCLLLEESGTIRLSMSCHCFFFFFYHRRPNLKLKTSDKIRTGEERRGGKGGKGGRGGAATVGK